MATVLTRTFAAALLLALVVAGCGGDDETEAPEARPTLTDPASVPTVVPDEGRAAFPLGGDNPLPPGSTEEPTVVPERPAARIHTVAEGETCGEIAALYNITVETLLAANPRINEDCTNLHVGEDLNIPAPDPAQAPSSSDDGDDDTTEGREGTIYIVVPGDTCAAIAQDHDLPLQTFLVANGLDEESCLTLQVGQEVVIP